MKACRIEQDLDVFAARRAARELASEVGFAVREGEEIAIVATELSTNILKYGVRGWLELAAVYDSLLGTGLKVIAHDQGPPFFDFATALFDGHDDKGPIDPAAMATRRGIGAGLGAVQRFCDAVTCAAEESGKAVTAIRYLRRPKGAGPRAF